MNIKDGGPAFPVTDGFSLPGERASRGLNGMSRREWFAGQALAGYAANEGCYLSDDIKVVRWAVDLADALLAELTRREREEETS